MLFTRAGHTIKLAGRDSVELVHIFLLLSDESIGYTCRPIVSRSIDDYAHSSVKSHFSPQWADRIEQPNSGFCRARRALSFGKLENSWLHSGANPSERYSAAGILIVISSFHLLRWVESSKSIVGFVERVELYLAPSSTAMGSTLERIVTRNTDETRFFKQKSTVFLIFLPFSLVVPGQAIVHLVELDELYLAPSTRVAGSVCGRIVSQKTPICSLTYPTYQRYIQQSTTWRSDLDFLFVFLVTLSRLFSDVDQWWIHPEDRQPCWTDQCLEQSRIDDGEDQHRCVNWTAEATLEGESLHASTIMFLIFAICLSFSEREKDSLLSISVGSLMLESIDWNWEEWMNVTLSPIVLNPCRRTKVGFPSFFIVRQEKIDVQIDSMSNSDASVNVDPKNCFDGRWTKEGRFTRELKCPFFKDLSISQLILSTSSSWSSSEKLLFSSLSISLFYWRGTLSNPSWRTPITDRSLEDSSLSLPTDLLHRDVVLQVLPIDLFSPISCALLIPLVTVSSIISLWWTTTRSENVFIGDQSQITENITFPNGRHLKRQNNPHDVEISADLVDAQTLKCHLKCFLFRLDWREMGDGHWTISRERRRWRQSHLLTGP